MGEEKHFKIGWYAIFGYQKIDEPCKNCGRRWTVENPKPGDTFDCPDCGWKVTILEPQS